MSFVLACLVVDALCFQVFSHMCLRFLEKELPPSLSVDDIRAAGYSPWLPRALRSPILVLVSGDVARPVSADARANPSAAKPGGFLFIGKPPRPARARRPP